MSTTFKPAYGSGTAFTLTIASLAATSYRQSTAVDNTSNLFADATIYGHIKSNAAGTANTPYNLYGYWSNDGGTTYSNHASGSDAAYTLNTGDSNVNMLLLASTIKTTAGADTFEIAPFSFVQRAGLLMLPAKWGVILFNGDSAALDATAGNHLLQYQGVNMQGV